HVARTSLENYLAGKNNPRFEIENNELNQNLGAFVTLRKNGQLRGCLGEFEPGRPLWRVVREKAIDAALHDPRFLPVTAEELSDIKIEISVLSPRQKISGPNKIELGKHGVVIQKGSHSGVFLPQVATETGWDLETFLSQLCSQKAGLSRDCWKDKKVQLYTFTAQVFTENSAEIKG
ncbi:MAG: AmmeMemoRadiSam system protein A, partial [Candidatus Cloacimonetes bacterium]|nr:AmmeMemoRadiSam system protein A [Candidatus Cloacimonadota bacterium]